MKYLHPSEINKKHQSTPKNFQNYRREFYGM